MLRRVFIVWLALAGFVPVLCRAQTTETETPFRIIVARINGVPVPLLRVERILNHMGGKAPGDHEPEDRDSLILRALDRVIFEELAYQKATAENMVVDPSEVEERIERIKTAMGDTEKFQEQLEKQQQTEEGLKADIERSMILDRILTREVFDQTAITDEQIRNEYEHQKSSFFRPEKIVITDIVFFLKQDDPQSLDSAERILSGLREGNDPDRLVPDGTFIAHEVDLKEEKDPDLYEAAKQLQVGEVSGIIHGIDALHIIKLKEFVPEKQFTLEEVRGMLEQKLKGEARKKRMLEWEAELKRAADIQIIDLSLWKDRLQ